jgi:aromatic-L-amino-acid decarboxylase
MLVKRADTSGGDLDPADWKGLRAQGHRMLDDVFDYIENIRERPVWQPIPDGVRNRFRESAPTSPTDIAEVHEEFMRSVLPFATGNVHPGFLGWVHGGGNVAGVLAEMLAAGINANLGGRDHAPIEVEQQIVKWIREFFGFPETASGLFVTGSSIANFIGVLVARTAARGVEVRRTGLAQSDARLVAYVSAAAHGCIAQAMDLCGLGMDALRIIPTNDRHQIQIDALEAAIATDRSAGVRPFLIVGNAGTVDIGAIDDLSSLARIAHRENMWFHVDGAIGALAVLAPDLAPRFVGIERADSIALDFHKWAQVPYDAGFILVRDGALHRSTFASPAAYMRRETRGLAAGISWPCDFGPDLSRGFRALKTWFTFKVYGTDALGAVMSHTCELAQYLEHQIVVSEDLELLAPVQLNIVCFGYRSKDSNRLNAKIVADLQESGIAAPSTTTIGNRLAIRAAIFNHRTRKCDIDALVKAVRTLGNAGVSSCTLLFAFVVLLPSFAGVMSAATATLV